MGKGDFFPKTFFHWGTNFVGKIYREIVLHGITNDQGEGVSQNAFSSNLNTENLKSFHNHGGIFT